MNYWAWQRLIHGPTVTPQFPCFEDYGNSNVPEKMDQTFEAHPNFGTWMVLEAWLNSRPCRKNKFRLNQGWKILNFENILGGKNFEFCRPNFLRHCSRPRWSFNVLIRVVEVRPRVGLRLVARAACRVSVIMTGQASDFEAFLEFRELSFQPFPRFSTTNASTSLLGL